MIAQKDANLFMVGASGYMFKIEFGRSYPDDRRAQFHTRIVMVPRHAKELLQTLRKTVEDYEATHGPILDEDET